MKLKYLLPTLALTYTGAFSLHGTHTEPSVYILEDSFLKKDSLLLEQRAKSGELSWAKGNAEQDEDGAGNTYGLSDPYADALLATFNGFEIEMTYRKAFELGEENPNNTDLHQIIEELGLLTHSSRHSMRAHWEYVDSVDIPDSNLIHDTDFLNEVYPSALLNLLQSLKDSEPRLIHEDFDIRSAYFDFFGYENSCTHQQPSYTAGELSLLARILEHCYDHETSTIITTEHEDIHCKNDLLDFIKTHLRVRMYASKIIQILKSEPKLPLIASLEPNTVDLVKSCLEAQGYSIGDPADLIQNTSEE